MTMRVRRTVLLCLLLAAGTARAGLILDTPILGGSLLVASDGHVQAQFLGSNAGFFNTLFLETPSKWGNGAIFDKYTPVNGNLVDLGEFLAGTELVFRLGVQTYSREYYSVYSGQASRNPYGIAHAEAITSLQGEQYVTRVGFEDLLGGGDKDYNDFMFRLTNVIDPPPVDANIPEPSILMLFAAGLLGLFSRRRRLVAQG